MPSSLGFGKRIFEIFSSSLEHAVGPPPKASFRMWFLTGVDVVSEAVFGDRVFTACRRPRTRKGGTGMPHSKTLQDAGAITRCRGIVSPNRFRSTAGREQEGSCYLALACLVHLARTLVRCARIASPPFRAADADDLPQPSSSNPSYETTIDTMPTVWHSPPSKPAIRLPYLFSFPLPS